MVGAARLIDHAAINSSRPGSREQLARLEEWTFLHHQHASWIFTSHSPMDRSISGAGAAHIHTRPCKRQPEYTTTRDQLLIGPRLSLRAVFYLLLCGRRTV